MKKVLSFLLCFLSISVLYAEENYISICSFNIAELGTSRENKDHQAIADMLGNYDLIVIHEVQDNGGFEHIQAIVEAFYLDVSGLYSWFIIESAGRGYPGNEGYAFIYRDPVVLDPQYDPNYGLKDTDVDYGRLPGWAYFKAGDFDFMVVGVHLHWSNLDKRTAEVVDLLEWLKEFADKPESEEKDLIIVGDTNRFGGYTVAQIENRETAFHQFLDDPTLGDKYRLLFCEHLISNVDVRIFKESLEEDTVSTLAGDLKITYVGHGSLMFTFDNKVIHVDPHSAQADYSKLPKADLIFITHEHNDHLDTTAINQIKIESSVMVYTEKCAASLSGGIVLKNGDKDIFEGIEVEAVPAYNIVHKRSNGEPYHPKGVGNGYIFTFGDKRVYVAGDTENTPEMKAFNDIDIAFLPMNLPYTMTPEMVADAALSFNPTILYPYHYGSTNTSALIGIFDSLSMDAKESYTDAGSTTVSDDNNMVYRQIIISQGVFNEFGSAQASLGDNIGIIDFDNTFTYISKTTEEIKDLISDHRPIYAKFRFDIGDDDGITTGLNNNTPLDFKLFHNYPNPFNPTTTIEYSLPQDGHVTLKIYNLSGQSVGILKDEYQQAGNYSFTWNATGMPSGLYFCALKAGGANETRKMVLVK